MRVTIHQPNVFPRLKVLQKIAAADLWIVLDSVQFAQREWQNRTRLVSVHGNCPEIWLTLPVVRPNGQHTLIRDVSITPPEPTIQSVSQTLKHMFGKTRGWPEISEVLNGVRPHARSMSLTEYCVTTTMKLLELTGRVPQLTYASSMKSDGKASRLIANLFVEANGSAYLADSGAARYLQHEDWQGLSVVWQQWSEPTTTTVGIESWRDISCLNYLAREGLDALRLHLGDSAFVKTPPDGWPVPNDR